jgi:hypothetical protein
VDALRAERSSNPMSKYILALIIVSTASTAFHTSFSQGSCRVNRVNRVNRFKTSSYKKAKTIEQSCNLNKIVSDNRLVETGFSNTFTDYVAYAKVVEAEQKAKRAKKASRDASKAKIRREASLAKIKAKAKAKAKEEASAKTMTAPKVITNAARFNGLLGN